jgi:hypothetical protein
MKIKCPYEGCDCQIILDSYHPKSSCYCTGGHVWHYCMIHGDTVFEPVETAEFIKGCTCHKNGNPKWSSGDGGNV